MKYCSVNFCDISEATTDAAAAVVIKRVIEKREMEATLLKKLQADADEEKQKFDEKVKQQKQAKAGGDRAAPGANDRAAPGVEGSIESENIESEKSTSTG